MRIDGKPDLYNRPGVRRGREDVHRIDRRRASMCCVEDGDIPVGISVSRTFQHASSTSSLIHEQRRTYLRLDQDQIDKQHHKVVLDVLVAEPPAVPAHREPDIRARVADARVLCPERPDGVPALDADGHRVLPMLRAYVIVPLFSRLLSYLSFFPCSLICLPWKAVRTYVYTSAVVV